MTVSAIARKTAQNYKDSDPNFPNRTDHMYPIGKFQDKTLSVIRAWLNEKGYLYTAENDLLNGSRFLVIEP